MEQTQSSQMNSDMVNNTTDEIELEKAMSQLKDDMANILEEENEELTETISVLQDRIDTLEWFKDECLETISQKDRMIRDTILLCSAITGIAFSFGLFYGVYFGCK